MEYLSRVEDVSALRLTSCVNLKHLELDVCPNRHQLRATTFLLSSCPNVETLLIYIRVKFTLFDKRKMECCWESQESSTEGILKNLKTVKFVFFEGNEGELDLVRYLLTNANILETMDINYFKQTQEMIVSMKEKIMAFIKVSPHAVISFSTY
ncbi:hypothetical protein AQUCO_02200136v1 [Aquilegia coerulea]|uniref:FBD domain-containing protein n=1 Tax=Aquilegia coerulea TaxID=218851 RepID=A0A2G5DDF9_AQUCA|nr:hypothetical protein AQUCO_02200136v1 [Aquilegia coerulea]